MLSGIPPHEKVRFRRSDIASLDGLPSAIPLPRTARVAVAQRRFLKAAAAAAIGACGAVALALAIVVSGLGDARLRVEAQKALAALADRDVEVSVGGVGISVVGLRGLAVRIDDVTVASAETGVEATRVGTAELGLDLLPLLGGRVRFGSLRVSDARIALAALPVTGGAGGFDIHDEAGRIDPDRAAAAVFDGVRALAGALGAQGVRRIAAKDVEIVLSGEADGMLRVVDATLRRRSGEGLRLSASLAVAGRPATVEGEAVLSSRDALVTALDLRLDAPAAAVPAARDPASPALLRAAGRVGGVSLRLAGAEAGGGDRLSLLARLGALDVPVGRHSHVVGDVEIAATAQTQTGKVEIERLHVAVGRSTWKFHGALGPEPLPDEVAGGTAGYRYELVSDGSSVSPDESAEPTLPVVARVAGRFDADLRVLDVDEIGVRSGQGEARGRARVRFEPGASPGLELRIDVGEMPVGHAKQLWPWFAAPGARRWVVANVFGGHVEGGWVEMGVEPGRLGDGVPLGRGEISGLFAVRGVRFDVAGRIPPVRDGVGTVAFYGTDVDIRLASGTVFMPSGRTAAAQGGTLTVRDAHIDPVIGKLDIDVAGQADAILELASYDPIAVGRFVDIDPGEMTGTVEGKVAADIPLKRGIDARSLGWKVELAYDGLALARAFEGQKVSEAKGTIVVDPTQAVIEAKARLNEIPATLRLVEPLGADKRGRERHVSLDMDDRTRGALAPGLDALLSGITAVKVEDLEPGRKAISADLGASTLTIPWIGWSKGAGVPATVAFDMLVADGRTELSDFSLKGESFAATGSVSLAGDGVRRVRFPSMRLNRGDDFSLDVECDGRGYKVTVRGRSLDARSAVKLYTRATGGETAGAGDTFVTVDLAVDAVSGFHGEVLRDVRLKYSGSGARTELAAFSAVTASGAAVELRDGRNGETRSLSVHSVDAGALLRFLDIYENMHGGQIAMMLTGSGDGALRGQIDARDFWLVDEPRLASIVSSPSTQDGRSLNQVVRGSIDTNRVQFERGYAEIVKGPGGLSLDRGILRGPLIGVSFQGTLHDANGNMAMTGTFMPAYGLNRIFGEIPLIGQVLGNGRDRGLIGITFRLAGRAGEPRLEVNPLSVIAPGIFRSVFEFR